MSMVGGPAATFAALEDDVIGQAYPEPAVTIAAGLGFTLRVLRLDGVEQVLTPTSTFEPTSRANISVRAGVVAGVLTLR